MVVQTLLRRLLVDCAADAAEEEVTMRARIAAHLLMLRRDLRMRSRRWGLKLGQKMRGMVLATTSLRLHSSSSCDDDEEKELQARAAACLRAPRSSGATMAKTLDWRLRLRCCYSDLDGDFCNNKL